MSSNTLPLDRIHAAAETTHADILALAGELLDAYYEAHPHSNAFGCDYEAPNSEPDGSIFMGRSDGTASTSAGGSVDYIMRRHPDPEEPRGDDEREYLFGDYGWMDVNSLVAERPFFRQAIENAIDRGFLDADARNRCAGAFDHLENTLQQVREEAGLADVAALVENHETDALKTLLATGDEESRVVWQMLHSTDDDDAVINNAVDVPVVDEDAGLMFVRSERYFQHDRREPDGKYYAYGVVIGIDDTDEVFFVHRLESDPDLRDPETEWTVGRVKEKMGFDMNLTEWVDAGKPHDVIVRVQGDLAFRRTDYRSQMWEYYETVLETERQRVVSEQMPELFADEETAFTERVDDALDDVADIYVNARSCRVSTQVDDTDALKALQDDLDIDEETVRDEQERRGIQRLTAKRRGEIIEDLVRDRIVRWACEEAETSIETLQEHADANAKEAFEDVDQQVNRVLGNHTVVMGPAREHPDREYTREYDCLAAVVVPDKATALVWHDEHENVDESLPEGVYEFQFLDGFEDAAWMSGG